MREKVVSVRKLKNGDIQVTVGEDIRFVQIRALTPDKKIEAVKQQFLALGAVWSEDLEGKVIKEIAL